MKNICIASFVVLMLVVTTGCGSNPPQAANDSKPAAESGESIYKRTCITCHQANGAGLPNSFPPLAKSDYLADKVKTIGQVIKGSSGDIVVNGNKFNNAMPAQTLSDEEIAAVLTYVYSSFGNSGAPVTVGEVKDARTKL